jgi:hypothetical protein
LSKITAVVNICDDSCSLVIFLKSSRFAFSIFKRETIFLDITNKEQFLTAIDNLYVLAQSYNYKKLLVFSQLEPKIANDIKKHLKKYSQIALKNLQEEELSKIKSMYTRNRVLLDYKLNNIDMCEAYYMNNLLKRVGGVFPPNYHPSIRNLEDRFLHNKDIGKFNSNISNRLFDAICNKESLDVKIKPVLSVVQKLLLIVEEIGTIKHIDEFVKQNLRFGFNNTNIDIILYLLADIAILDKSMEKQLQFPKFIVNFVQVLNKYNQNIKANFEYNGKILLVKNCTKVDSNKIKMPNSIEVVYENSHS